MELLNRICQKERERILDEYFDCEPIGYYQFRDKYLNDIPYDTDLLLFSATREPSSFKAIIDEVELFTVYIVNEKLGDDCGQESGSIPGHGCANNRITTTPNDNGYIYKLPKSALNSPDTIVRKEYRKIAREILPYLAEKISIKVGDSTYSQETLVIIEKYHRKLSNDDRWEFVPIEEKPRSNRTMNMFMVLVAGIYAMAGMIKELEDCSDTTAMNLALSYFNGGRSVDIGTSIKIGLFDPMYFIALYKSQYS